MNGFVAERFANQLQFVNRTLIVPCDGIAQGLYAAVYGQAAHHLPAQANALYIGGGNACKKGVAILAKSLPPQLRRLPGPAFIVAVGAIVNYIAFNQGTIGVKQGSLARK